jgi:hypothetical protein
LSIISKQKAIAVVHVAFGESVASPAVFSLHRMNLANGTYRKLIYDFKPLPPVLHSIHDSEETALSNQMDWIDRQRANAPLANQRCALPFDG